MYICTGYGREGDRPYLAPYYPNQTAVFLMAVGRLKELCQNLEKVGAWGREWGKKRREDGGGGGGQPFARSLVAGLVPPSVRSPSPTDRPTNQPKQTKQQVGYPATTPVAIVERASTPRQRTLLGTVATIPALAEAEKAAAPAVVVVGEVVHVLLERGGPRVLHGAVMGWAAEEGAGAGEGEEQGLVGMGEDGRSPEAASARGLVGGMRGGGVGEGSPRESLPRRVVGGAVAWVRGVLGRGEGRRRE